MTEPVLWTEKERAETRPFDFAQAKAAHIRASDLQAQAQQDLRDAAEKVGDKKRAYRGALAAEMLRLHAKQKKAITACRDLAFDNAKVAELRYELHIAEGEYEAAKQFAFQVAADRRGLEQLVEWSRRVAIDGQEPEPRRPRAA